MKFSATTECAEPGCFLDPASGSLHASNARYTRGALDHVPVTYFGTQFTRGTANNVQSTILSMASLFRGNHILIRNFRFGRGVADLDIPGLGTHVSH